MRRTVSRCDVDDLVRGLLLAAGGDAITPQLRLRLDQLVSSVRDDAAVLTDLRSRQN
jgi:hypothetical protein